VNPRITVGLPVYKGADLIAKALVCLQRQTFRDFEVIISVDGDDADTAAACRPFLTDPRFRMIVQPERLDWVGNFNWLLQQDMREFFCYRQHDDTTAPNFFERLLQAAGKDRNVAALCCDCQYGNGHVERAPSIDGEPLDRVLQYIDRPSEVPVRGLIRKSAIQQAGLVRTDEFRAYFQVFGWLASVLRWGSFRRVAEPLYYKLDSPHNYTNQWHTWPDDRKRAAWTTLFTGLLEAGMPLCRTPEERLFLQRSIVNRFFVGRGFPRPENNEPSIAEYLDRLKYEKNEHLLGAEQFRHILQELHERQADIELVERSRIRRIVHRIRQRSERSKVIYPTSRMRRVGYQSRHLLNMITRKMRLLAPT
jgi:Glycosyl transferase family 2